MPDPSVVNTEGCCCDAAQLHQTLYRMQAFAVVARCAKCGVAVDAAEMLRGGQRGCPTGDRGVAGCVEAALCRLGDRLGSGASAPRASGKREGQLSNWTLASVMSCQYRLDYKPSYTMFLVPYL